MAPSGSSPWQEKGWGAPGSHRTFRKPATVLTWLAQAPFRTSLTPSPVCKGNHRHPLTGGVPAHGGGPSPRGSLQQQHLGSGLQNRPHLGTSVLPGCGAPGGFFGHQAFFGTRGGPQGVPLSPPPLTQLTRTYLGRPELGSFTLQKAYITFPLLSSSTISSRPPSVPGQERGWGAPTDIGTSCPAPQPPPPVGNHPKTPLSSPKPSPPARISPPLSPAEQEAGWCSPAASCSARSSPSSPR